MKSFKQWCLEGAYNTLLELYENTESELKKLGFNLLLTVHDEIIGEAPIENAKQVAEKLVSIMVNSAKPEIQVPMKCDAEITKSWYGEKIDV